MMMERHGVLMDKVFKYHKQQESHWDAKTNCKYCKRSIRTYGGPVTCCDNCKRRYGG